MKFYLIGGDFGIDRLMAGQGEIPRPGPGQVLVRMKAASLNYRDLLVIEGKYSRKLHLPLIPLSDGTGEVVETGEGVSLWKQGDRVAGTFFQEWLSGEITPGAALSALGGAINGVLAEYVVFDQQGLVSIPGHLSFEEGATLPCAAVTAWHALSVAGIRPGSTVLTLGTGGVSIFSLQFARLAGARVLSTTGSESKEGRLKGIGAAEVINYRKEPDWDRRALELTDGRGVDLVVEVGGAGTLGKSLNAVRMSGHISLIGVLTGSTGEVNPLPAVMKSVSLHGIYVGSREMFTEMNRAIELHDMRPVIDRVFPFSEAKAALRHLQGGSHFGKVVISF